MIGHEERVELAGFQLADQLLQMRKIKIGVRPGTGVAPGAGVNADRPHESAEFQLTLCHDAFRDRWRWRRDRHDMQGMPLEDFFVFVQRSDKAASLRAQLKISLCILPP